MRGEPTRSEQRAVGLVAVVVVVVFVVLVLVAS